MEKKKWCVDSVQSVNRVLDNSAIVQVFSPSAVSGMLNPERREAPINLFKKLCDGLESSLSVFFREVR